MKSHWQKVNMTSSKFNDIIKIRQITENGGKISMDFPSKIPNIFAPNSKVCLALLEISELSCVSKMAIENLKQQS